MTTPDRDVFVSLGYDDDDEALVVLHLNGGVEFGPNYTPSAAADAFWKSLSEHNPYGVVVASMKTLAIGCPEHPAYRGVAAPNPRSSGPCETCVLVHEARLFLKPMGILS